MIVLSALLVCLLIWKGFSPGEDFFIYWAGAATVFIVMISIFSVVVECDDYNLYIRYGIGFVAREIPIYEIRQAGPVKNDSVFTLPYNPKGENALRIVLRSGAAIMLPAEQPKLVAQELLRRAH